MDKTFIMKNADTKFSFLSKLNLDQDVKSRLSLLLDGTVKGSDEIYISPLALNKSPDSILRGWDGIYESNNSLINSVLDTLEKSNRDKFGPRSIASSWSKRLEGALSYFEREGTISNLPGINLPFSDKGRFRPISLANSVNSLKNDTNSGLPYYTRKSKVKARYLEKFDQLLQRKDPCVLFTRTQEGGKTRNVWGYPAADTINEYRYYSPLLAYQRNKDWRSVLKGVEALDIKISKMLNFASSGDYIAVSIDFSAYDASIDPKLTRRAFDYVKFLFNKSYHKEIDDICERFISIGLLTPSGVLEGDHGIPSGSTFTNEIGSIVQKLIADESGLVVDDLSEIQGDDGAYIIKASDFDAFVSAFEYYNLNVNKTKSYNAKEYLIYLQCLHHIDYKDSQNIIHGIYPTYRALNRIIYQERWFDFEEYEIKGSDYYSIRSLSILENCKHHPLFKEIVRYVMDLDKYKLSPSPDGLAKYIEMNEAKQGKDVQSLNQYGDKIRGIKNFESYKLVKSML